MQRSLVSVLIAAAYCSVASAQIHIIVQNKLINDFLTYIEERTDPLKWDTAKFWMWDSTENDYSYLATVKLDGADVLSIRVLAAGFNGKLQRTLIEPPNTNAFYTGVDALVYLYSDHKQKAYDIAKQDFLSKAKNVQMECTYFASAETVIKINEGEDSIGTYLLVAFRGYTSKAATSTTGLTLKSASISLSGAEPQSITFCISPFA